HAAWREGTARHVYFVQVAAVAGYALVRAVFARGLRPEFDALFALILGFILVGVTIQARRAGIPPVAAATRRFAAVLPIAIALLVYAPAAVQVTFQVGAAQNGLYPVLFGVACLAGVAIGMLLHIRAYLALGTGFLVLDITASLVQAGLRDHRIGFLVLSLSGI